MKLYTIDGNRLKSVDNHSFKLEKEIQTLVENNLDELFNLEFVKSELPIKNFRLDTLAYDQENKSFVIIEYKRERNFSVIDQGYTYMSILLNNKADFILEYHDHCGITLKKNEVDWTQSKVIFISPYFTEYQKTSVDFKDVPFELWEIKRYVNGLIGLNQHKTTSKESITATSKSKEDVVLKVTQQVTVHTEESLLNKSKSRPEWVVEIYKKLRDRVLNLGEVEVVPKKRIVSFQRKYPILGVSIHNEGLYCVLNMRRGTLQDPSGFSILFDEDALHVGEGDYYFNIQQDTDLDYVMFLINQSYKKKLA
ncbi:DUF5655 domain-containing protein [Persicitalea jodogahamensis]|uniref:DUF5655 domain-containing protein n=1 Tax=Persicitalea jodogahamensis TaxID=402147 RepID=A0A8J3D5S4_9BACT|nr:DUF5655 domain-containing protein [Persicitalea jodogahamensis]GHB79339.1 hypothetical protein GCM10007390_36670 [Persicitalea jodogahamensis]